MGVGWTTDAPTEFTLLLPSGKVAVKMTIQNHLYLIYLIKIVIIVDLPIYS